MITSLAQLDLNKRYTYKDYLTWKLTDRIELIRGKIFRMTPAPSTEHQRISGNLYKCIANFLERKSCEVFSASIDVRFINDQRIVENTF